MTFPTLPTLPAQPATSLAGAPLPADDGQADSSTGEPEGATDGQQLPQTLTAEQVQALLDQQARRIQSQMDKREARLLRQLNGQTQGARATQALDALGVKLPDGKKADDVIAALRAQNLLPPEESDDDDADSNGAGAPDPINQAGQVIAQQFGLVTGDPELQLIRTNGTPQEYLQSITVAGLAKLQRLQQAPQLAARLPGLMNGQQAPPSNPIENVNSTDDLYQMAWAQRSPAGTGRRR